MIKELNKNIWKFDETGQPVQRKCSMCGEWKTFDKFVKRASAPYGLHSNCKICQSQHSMASRKNQSAGVYTLTAHTDEGQFIYVGATGKLKKRRTDHKNDLKQKRHKNEDLQHLYNSLLKQYNDDHEEVWKHFEFQPVQTVRKTGEDWQSKLFRAEQLYLMQQYVKLFKEGNLERLLNINDKPLTVLVSGGYIHFTKHGIHLQRTRRGQFIILNDIISHPEMFKLLQQAEVLEKVPQLKRLIKKAM